MQHKKVWRVMLSCITAVCLLFPFAACGDDNVPDVDDVNPPITDGKTEHTNHIYEWVMTEEPTCLTKGTKLDKCACGDLRDIGEVPALGHDIQDGICTRCSHGESQGLEFELIEDAEGYAVMGIGTCTDEDIIVPSIYKGEPVTAIASTAFYLCKSFTSITVPDSVEIIGQSALAECNITFLAIGKGATNILAGAIAKCNSLESIILSEDNPKYYTEGNCIIEKDSKILLTAFPTSKIPDDVTAIGKYAFSGANLRSIIIPDSVTSIKKSAFFSCNNLSSVTIGRGVTSIEETAFANCYLSTIVIPKNVTKIEAGAFLSCSRMTKITYEGTKKEWNNISKGSVPENADGFVEWYYGSSITTVQCTDGDIKIDKNDGAEHTHTYEWETTLEPTCTTKGSQTGTCFCGDVKEQELSALEHNLQDGQCTRCDYRESQGLAYRLNQDGESYSVTGLGTCKDLDIIIPSTHEGKPVTSIGNQAFYSRNSLTSIVIPDSVTSIETFAFYGCRSLTSIVIPAGVTSIKFRTFEGCSSLTSIEIPDSVTSIETSAFEGCSSLTSIEIPDSVTSIGSSAFEGCSSLANIEIPDSVTAIGASTFEGCSSLANIKIPDSVTAIGASTFEGCSSLANIEIPDSVTAIGAAAFYMTAYYQNDSNWANDVLYIGNHLIAAKDTILGNYTVHPKTLTIAASAFEGCSGLTNIEIPESVTSIGAAAFYQCSNLMSIDIPDNVTAIELFTFYECNSLKSIDIPHSVTSIGEYAFGDCSSLTSIDIPDSVTQIGEYAFVDCIGLTSIVIPDSVTSIESYSFFDCSNLTSVTIGDGVTEIGYYAFDHCYSLTEVHITDIAAWCNISFKHSNANPLYYAHNLFLNDILVTNLVIPNGVTSIGRVAFYDCSSLTSIIIPESVTVIGSAAFEYCSNLKSINLPKNLTSIENYTFYGCSSLTNIEIPDGVTYIGKSAFNQCSSLTSLKIPDSVAEIAFDSFWHCGGMENITVSANNPKYYSEGNCLIIKASKALILGSNTSKIPNNVTSIGNYAFAGCSLKSIEIPHSVNSIGDGAFSECSSLTSFVIPDSVTSIGMLVFSGCSSLTEIAYEGSKAEWNLIALNHPWWNVYSSITTVHCKDGDVAVEIVNSL